MEDWGFDRHCLEFALGRLHFCMMDGVAGMAALGLG
jgi:hypothetical protein